MIRQLTADEQHRLDHAVNRLIEKRAIGWVDLEGIFLQESALAHYLAAKATAVESKRAEPIEEDNSWERHWAQEGLPRSPFDSGWHDVPLDSRTGQYLEDIGTNITSKLEDKLAEGTADRLDFARNARRSKGRKRERTK